MSDVADKFEIALKNYFKPDNNQMVYEWAEDNIYISERQTQVPGPFSTLLTPYVREPLECFRDQTCSDLVLCWGSQTSKALSLDTPIPTPNGWSTIGDISVGDDLFGRDGKIVKVIKTTETFLNRDCYEIEIGTGEKIIADAGHLWKISKNIRKRGYAGNKRIEWTERGEFIIETKDIHSKGRNPMRLPVCDCIQTDNKNLEIHPYVLGAWLGDGHSAGNRITIHKDEIEILDKIKDCGYPYEIKKIKNGALTAAIDSRIKGKTKDNLDRFYLKLKRLGLLNNKHIPKEYLRSSKEQRLEILRGLMDTDGHATQKGRCGFVTVYENLSNDFFELLSSLGIKSNPKIRDCKINGIIVGKCFSFEFNANEQKLFYLKRKQDRIKKIEKPEFVRLHEIKSIKKVNSVPVRCIGVSSTDNLFLCGKSFLPTHNTTTIQVGVSYRIIHKPTPIVWVMPNTDLAQSFSENRWIPMVEDCPQLKALKPADKDKFKKIEQQFKRCTLTFVGSNSPANLASRPAGLLLMDEIDKFGAASNKEASALMLAENRTKTFTSPLRVKTSTPTTRYGEIWQEFERGDMRFYNVPCPHCAKEIKLEWKQVKWDENARKENGKWDLVAVANSAYYECQQCKGKIYDAHKTRMLRMGRWIPTNPLAELGRRSYHLNSLYAPWRSCSFGRLASQFLQAKETLNGLQDFINGALAEPWDEDAAHERKDDLTESYDVNAPWEEEAMRFMTVDVQESHFWYVIRQWSNDGKSRLLSEGRLLTFEDIDNTATAFNVQKKAVSLDIAHRTNEVCGALIRYGWTGLWGDPQGSRKHFTHVGKNGFKVNRIYSPIQRRDANIGSGRAAFAPFFFWCGNPVKDILDKLRKTQYPGWLINPTASDDYKWQIDAEVKKTKHNNVTGRDEVVWFQIRKDNHLRDCELMQVVCASIANLIQINVQAEKLTIEKEEECLPDVSSD